MKTQVSIFFLLILFLPSVGTTLWFFHRQKEIRREVKHQLISGLEDTELAHLSFTENELASLEWKHEKEFKFEGHMYDVVKRKKVGDTYHFWCWKDDKETALYQQFESLLAQLSTPVPDDQRSTLKWLQFHNTLFCNSLQGWQLTPIKEMKIPVAVPYINLYHSIDLGALSPPPLVG